MTIDTEGHEGPKVAKIGTVDHNTKTDFWSFIKYITFIMELSSKKAFFFLKMNHLRIYVGRLL